MVKCRDALHETATTSLLFIMKRGIILSIFIFTFSFVLVNNTHATTVSETYTAPSSNVQSIKFSDLGSLPDVSTLDSSKVWTYTVTFNVLQRYNYNSVSFGYNNKWFPCFTMTAGSYPRSVVCSYNDYSVDNVAERTFYDFSNISFLNSYSLTLSDYYSGFVLSVSDDTSGSCPEPEPSEPCDDPEENSRFIQVVLDAFWKYHIAFAGAIPAILVIFFVYRLLKGRIR